MEVTDTHRSSCLPLAPISAPPMEPPSVQAPGAPGQRVPASHLPVLHPTHAAQELSYSLDYCQTRGPTRSVQSVLLPRKFRLLLWYHLACGLITRPADGCQRLSYQFFAQPARSKEPCDSSRSAPSSYAGQPRCPRCCGYSPALRADRDRSDRSCSRLPR